MLGVKSFIKTHSKEIAESFLSTRNKKETGRTFGISNHGVERALYYEGLEEHISPVQLARMKSRKLAVTGPVKAEVPLYSQAPPLLTKSRLHGKLAVERGIALTNARKWVYEYSRGNPEAQPTQIQKALKGATGEIVATSTIGGWLRRKARKAITPTTTEPTVFITTPADIADALLSRVVNYLHDYDSLLEDRANLKEMTKEVRRLGNELKEVREERDRLLKIHNDQVKRHALTSVKELELLATGKELSHARQR